MVVSNPGVKAGDPYDLKDGVTQVKMVPKASGVTVVKGDIVIIDTTTDPWTYKKAAFAAVVRGKFGVVINDPTKATDTKVEILHKGKVYLPCEVNLMPHAAVAHSSATNGRVEQFVKSAIGGAFNQAELQAVQNDMSRIMGTYYGKAGEFAEGTESKITVAGTLGCIDIGDYTGRYA